MCDKLTMQRVAILSGSNKEGEGFGFEYSDGMMKRQPLSHTQSKNMFTDVLYDKDGITMAADSYFLVILVSFVLSFLRVRKLGL